MVGLRGSISQSQASLYRIYVVLKVVPKLENLEVYIPDGTNSNTLISMLVDILK